MSDTIEFQIIRDVFQEGKEGDREGFTLGRLMLNDEQVAFTLEDQDRHLEEGNGKFYGKTAIPVGRYELVLYNSPKHGMVPLFKDVPGFSYIEMHKANHAEELLGCVAVGDDRTVDGVCNCAPVLHNIVEIMQNAKMKGHRVFCEIKRA